MKNYTYPPIEENYQSNNSIVVNDALENSVIKLSRVFLDSLFSNNVLPQDIIDGLIEDPDSIQARTSLEMDGTLHLIYFSLKSLWGSIRAPMHLGGGYILCTT